MTKSTDQRETWWRAIRSAVVECGPSLYLGLHSIEGIDSATADELWVAVFTQTFRQIRLYQKAPDRWSWFQTRTLALAADRGLTLDAATFAQYVTFRELTSTEVAEHLPGTGRQRMSLQIAPSLIIPEEMWTRLRKYLLAEEALRDAQRRSKGPTWSRYALLGTAVVGLAAVIYGVADVPNAGASISDTGPRTSLAAALPQPLSNLPTVTEAQFRVNNSAAFPSLNHAVITSKALYIPILVSDASGQEELSVRQAPFSMTGRSWSSVSKLVGKIVLTAPNAPGTSSVNSTPSLNLADWQFVVSDQWADAVVSWSDGSSVTVVQIYQLNLTSHQTKLLKTIQPTNQTTSVYVAAAGAGRIVVQPGVTEGTVGSKTIVGLPIQVYNLAVQRDAALSQVTEIPGSFGLMQNPTVSDSGVIFQGINGQSQDITAVDSRWYQLLWNGSLTRLQGPPIDNQQHWALQSTNGQLWWAETTPAAHGSLGGKQVLMGRLSPAGSPANTPSVTLSGSVNQFSVSGSHLVWEQKDGNVTQVVVSEVKQ